MPRSCTPPSRADKYGKVYGMYIRVRGWAFSLPFERAWTWLAIGFGVSLRLNLCRLFSLLFFSTEDIFLIVFDVHCDRYMASQFSSLQTPKKRPNYSGPSDIAPSGLMQSPHQLYMGSEFQNTSPFSVLGHGAPGMNVPRVSELAPSFASPYLTGSASESDPTGNGTIFSLPPHPYYGCQMVPNGDNHGEIPVTDIGNGHGIIPLSNMDPPFPAQAPLSYTPSAYPPNGSIPGAHHWYHTTRPSESAGDAPGSASPTALQYPHGQRSSLFQTFIDDNPLLNKAYDVAKGRVASYSILKASEARRQNPAPFICEYCQATFTRSHNLSYHRDAHLGIKRHSSLCGKKFGTPSGTKRHEDNCSKCKGASRDTLSPG